MLRGRSNNHEASRVVLEALMCKAFGCTPSELRREDSSVVEEFMVVYEEAMRRNPLFMM